MACVAMRVLWSLFSACPRTSVCTRVDSSSENYTKKKHEMDSSVLIGRLLIPTANQNASHFAQCIFVSVIRWRDFIMPQAEGVLLFSCERRRSRACE